MSFFDQLMDFDPEVASACQEELTRQRQNIELIASENIVSEAVLLAAGTVLPVIGIPVAGGALNGLDALYATVQMPSGVPVATVACGSAGPTNAALLAVQILGTADAALREKFHAHKKTIAEKVAKANAKIHEA